MWVDFAHAPRLAADNGGVAVTSSETTTRWLRVGSSNAEDARTAGTDAAGQAMAGGDGKLLIVFCSDAYDLDELLGGIAERAGGVPVIG